MQLEPTAFPYTTKLKRNYIIILLCLVDSQFLFFFRSDNSKDVILDMESIELKIQVKLLKLNCVTTVLFIKLGISGMLF